MNKSVSNKNSILRFKLRRIIEKFLNPAGPVRYTPGGLPILDTLLSDFNIRDYLDPNSPNYKFHSKYYNKNNSSDQLNYSKTNNYKNNPSYKYFQRVRNWKTGYYKAQNKFNSKLNEIKNRNNNSSVYSGTTRKFSNPTPTFNGIGIERGWRGTIGQIDDNSWKQLQEMGYKGNRNASDAQNFINSLTGVSGNQVAIDNKWGNLSRSALLFLYDKKFGQTGNPSNLIDKRDINVPLSELNDASIQGTTDRPITVEGASLLINSISLPSLPLVRTGNYNRSQIRQLMRNAGYNPYAYTGLLRRALKMYLNGQTYDPNLLTGIDLSKFKQGGQLVSRNPVLRFKSNFRLVAQ